MKKSIFSVFLVVLLIPSVGWAANGDQGREASYFMWRLVNEARMAPLKALERAGISETSAREALGEWGWVLDYGLPPLAWNAQLEGSAAAHGQDMLEKVYYDYDAPDGTTPRERIAAQGYAALDTGERLGILAFNNYVAPLEAAYGMFRRMLADDLNPDPARPKTILHPYLTEVGITVQSAAVDLGLAVPTNLYLAVMDGARPLTDRGYLIGNVYQQGGKGGTWTPASGAQGMQVVIRSLGDGAEYQCRSLGLGAYQVPLPTGFCLVEVRDPEGEIRGRWLAFGDGHNRFMDLGVTP